MSERVRRARIALGMSQADLARASGLSRQAIGALEAGRHTPSVSAALAVAAALGEPVEALFGTPPAGGTPILGTSGSGPAAAVRVGDELCFSPLHDLGAGAAGWERADGTVTEGRFEPFPDANLGGIAAAGCDPALGLAARMLPAQGARRVVAIEASSGRAVEALDAGRLHVALVHGPADSLPANRRAVTAAVVVRWEVGLAHRAGRAVDLEAVAAGRAVVARRDSGAGAQRALGRALAARGLRERVEGPVARGHFDAARRVAYGGADAGVTMRPAALAYGLDFKPLEEHAVELRNVRDFDGHPGVAALRDVMESSAFRARLEALGGYELSTAS